MHKILNNYFYKLGLFFIAICSMNFTNKMVYCALIFTILTTILNGIAKCHGSKKATISILSCTSIALLLLYNKPYFIAGKPINHLIPTSLGAILVASYIGYKIFLKLETRLGFPLSNCISLFIAALVDHLIMGLFFARLFPMRSVCSMFYKETVYTYLFGSLIYLLWLAFLYAKPIYRKLKAYLTLSSSRRLAEPKTPPRL